MANGMEVDEGNEVDMMKMVMGFGAFKTTKNLKVPGNAKNYGLRKEKKTEYRQYMNRQGGFNRPLSPG
jgi:U4/U6.U5 tri-snRNP-associated protein 3